MCRRIQASVLIAPVIIDQSTGCQNCGVKSSARMRVFSYGGRRHDLQWIVENPKQTLTHERPPMQYPRIGEALVRGERHRLAAAEPELMIGDLNGPVGVAFATLLGGQ